MNILNLDKWAVIETAQNDHDYRIVARYEIDTEPCLHCYSRNISRFGKIEQLYMDLPVHAKRVGIEVQRQRYRCNDCHKTYMQYIPDIDDKRSMTKRLVEYIQNQALKRTFTSVADDIGIDEKTVRNIFKAHVKSLAETVIFATPEWLGIDELYLLKKPRCIITNVKERTVINLLENRNKPTVTEYLRQMQDKQTIKIVTMDMWQPYRDAVKVTLPKAQIVVDKFHIVRMANQSLEVIRKSLRAGLKDRQRRTLMHDRFILLRRKHELTEKDRLLMESWTGTFPSLGTAYELKEGFIDIWLADDDRGAKERYKAWVSDIPLELQPAFAPIVTAMTNWHEEVFAYFRYDGATNAYTEALNGLVKLANKVGRGYSFEAIRAKLLYGTGMHKTQRPKYSKSWEVHEMGIPEPDINYGNDLTTLITELEQEVENDESTSKSE